MGDRANVAVLDYDPDKAVYLYAHWTGTDLFKVVAEELLEPVTQDRWSDGSYLTRILFQRVLNRIADPNESTSFGISAGLIEGDYDHILVLDPETERAAFREERSYHLGRVEADMHHGMSGDGAVGYPGRLFTVNDIFFAFPFARYTGPAPGVSAAQRPITAVVRFGDGPRPNELAFAIDYRNAKKNSSVHRSPSTHKGTNSQCLYSNRQHVKN